jgi:hypothetical protein
MASSYMNGFFGYLPPGHAFLEGGYEVGWAENLALREDMQSVMWRAIESLVVPHAG